MKRFVCLGAFLISFSAYTMGSNPKTSGVNIGQKLDPSFEPSGGAWHPRLEKFFLVSDSGLLASLSPDGSLVKSWQVSGNWEGVAVADPSTNVVYLLNELSAKIYEFDFVKGKVQRVFSLLNAIPESSAVIPLNENDKDALVDGEDDKTGAESLAIVPNTNSQNDALFYVGSQENGFIYRFRLPLNKDGQVKYAGKFKSWNYNDLSGLEYDWKDGSLWAVWDSENRIRKMKTNGELIKEWSVPTGSQAEEGLGVNGTTLFISEDEGSSSPVVKRYDNFR